MLESEAIKIQRLLNSKEDDNHKKLMKSWGGINYRQTFAEQSASFAVQTFFAFVKAVFIGLILIVAILAAGQSQVAPVSMRLLTTYAMEYAVASFKPYRGYFPEPYLIEFDNK